MYKKPLLMLLVILGVTVLGKLGADAYLEYKNPVGKCFKLKDSGGMVFVEKLVFKVIQSLPDKMYLAKLVDFQQPETIEELVFTLSATTGNVKLQDPNALYKVKCPVEPKN